MGNTVERFGPVPPTFKALYARYARDAVKPVYQRRAGWDRPIASRDFPGAIRAVDALPPAVNHADVRTKLWELRGEWEEHQRDRKDGRQSSRQVLGRRLRDLDRALRTDDYDKAKLVAPNLAVEREGLRQQLARPPHGQPMPVFYDQRVHDLKSLGVPAELIPPLVRALGIPLRGKRPATSA